MWSHIESIQLTEAVIQVDTQGPRVKMKTYNLVIESCKIVLYPRSSERQQMTSVFQNQKQAEKSGKLGVRRNKRLKQVTAEGAEIQDLLSLRQHNNHQKYQCEPTVSPGHVDPLGTCILSVIPFSLTFANSIILSCLY